MLLYYITDRRQFPGDERERRERLLHKIGEAALCGVDYVQMREKDLSVRDLETLALEAMERIRASGRRNPSADQFALPMLRLPREPTAYI